MSFQSTIQQNSSYHPRKKNNFPSEDDIEQMEHKYPFKANIRLNNTSINEKQISLNVRRPSEFNNIEARIAFDPEYKQRLLYAKQASKTSNPKTGEEKKR